jgi:phosphate transport system permease protein
MSDIENASPDRRFAIGRWRSALDNVAEHAVEWTIRICGWSAIFFVMAIFFFVFRTAFPVVIGTRASARVVVTGPNNDLVFHARQRGTDWNGTKVIFSPGKGPEVTLTHDRESEELVIRYAAGHSTARDVVDALAADPLAELFRVELAPTDRLSARKKQARETPNDGRGAIPAWDRSGSLSPILRGGNDPLDLGEFFSSPNWRPTSEVRPQYGILALVIGSLSVAGIAMVIAVPFGLGAAVFVSEFCAGKVKETLKIVIELLAAVPSVVWGFIGMMVLGPIIMEVTGAPVGVNLLNGGIILSLMSVPIIVSVGEDALKAVPDSYREAAVSLGATRWEIVCRVLFPAAKNGLLAAVLLGVGRAIGETMAVLMATGHAVQIPGSLLDPVRTLTATIAAELGETVEGDTHYRVLFLIGVVLFAVTFVVDLVADMVVKGIRSEKTG